jgi:tetratricopeptide (TPR) repeat protein
MVSNALPRVVLVSAMSLAVLFPSNVFAYKKVELRVLRPPQVVLPDVEVLAVFDFDASGEIEWAKYNKGSVLKKLLGELVVEPLAEAWIGDGLGQNFAARLRSELAERQAGSAKLFRVMSPDEIQQAMDPEESPDEGQALGAQAEMLGSIRFYGETVDGKGYREWNAKTDISIKIIRSGDGGTLAEREFTANASRRQYGDQIGSSPNTEDLVNETLEQLGRTIPDYITPRYESLSLEFQKVRSRSYRKEAEKALNAAIVMDLQQASSTLTQLLREHPKDRKIYYNLGIVWEAGGNLDEAEKCYKKAYDLKGRKRYREAMKRIAKRRAEVDKLEVLGIYAAPTPR